MAINHVEAVVATNHEDTVMLKVASGQVLKRLGPLLDCCANSKKP